MSRLKVRFGKQGGVASPTSTIGHVAQLVVVAAFSALVAGKLVADWDGWRVAGPLAPIMVVVCALILSRTIRDAIAWSYASDAEREAFVQGIAAMRKLAASQPAVPPSRRDTIGWVVLLTLMPGGFAGLLTWIAISRGDTSAILPAAICAALWIGCSLQKVRAYRRGVLLAR